MPGPPPRHRPPARTAWDRRRHGAAQRRRAGRLSLWLRRRLSAHHRSRRAAGSTCAPARGAARSWRQAFPGTPHRVFRRVGRPAGSPATGVHRRGSWRAKTIADTAIWTAVSRGVVASAAIARDWKRSRARNQAAGRDPHDPATVPTGFVLDEARPPERFALEGRHLFAIYRWVFELDEEASQRTRVRATSWAKFPGLHGKVYRALVIGSGGYRIAVRWMLKRIAAAAHPRRAGAW
jgi:hypothetical protein